MCDHIRGKSVEEARAILALTPRAVARDWSKLLESAVANAEHNHELVGDDLKIVAVYADEGPTLKRFRPRAMGRATRIRKRTSHLTIQLTPKETNAWDRRFIPSHARGLHPRLEVELVQRAQLRRLPGARTSRSATTSSASSRTPGLSRHHDPQGRQRGGGQHPHRAPGHRDRQVRQRGRRAAPRPAPDDRASRSRSTSSRSSAPSSTPSSSRSRSPSSSRTASPSAAR